MKKELSAIELHYLLKELTPRLEQARVKQIYHPTKEEVLFTFHSAQYKKQILRVSLPGFLYLTQTKGDTPKLPSGFCMFLRKHLIGARITNIQTLGFDRIIQIDFDIKQIKYQLIIELVPPGNVILVQENKILVPLNHQNLSERTVRPGKEYVPPKPGVDPRTINTKELMQFQKESDTDLVRTLATVGLGGRYAEELLANANIDKTKKDLSEEEAETIIKHLRALLDKPIQAQSTTKNNQLYDITPFSLQTQDLEAKEFPSYNDALDHHLTEHKEEKQQQEAAKPKLTQQQKVQNIINQQKKYLEDNEKKINTFQSQGEAIYERYQEVQEILEQINKARENLSWKEIKAKLKGHKVIKQINEKEGTITIELNDQ